MSADQDDVNEEVLLPFSICLPSTVLDLNVQKAFMEVNDSGRLTFQEIAELMRDFVPATDDGQEVCP